ncbi:MULTISPECIES: DUF4186 domain-containing protein [Dickeya]|uniref:Cytoplasmic protein n=1 Tax=Dickeya aquatica TaxID=1401087 RepID=A0A375A815_9GAMM|nr:MULTISPECIES: DUF4186 domain-containing protein [Dickeya]SLM62165.1 hypothetical protein DAQ1742_01149 [Dickeya aquatica]
MPDFDLLFSRLSRSRFRQRFHLKHQEREYCINKGKAVIAAHAASFITQRLMPATPANDGKQTPMRGHPVFIAQHATATCCRRCLEKWHGIPQHAALTLKQQDYIVNAILYWLERELSPSVQGQAESNMWEDTR